MANQKAKGTKGTRNDGRSNGKAWKQGKHPEVRAAELKKKTDARRAARAAKNSDG